VKKNHNSTIFVIIVGGKSIIYRLGQGYWNHKIFILALTTTWRFNSIARHWSRDKESFLSYRGWI